MIDFGEYFNASNPPEDFGTPGYYRSPELLLDYKLDIQSDDVWGLGCTFFEIRTGRKYFDSFGDDKDEYLEDMCLVFGRLPEPW